MKQLILLTKISPEFGMRLYSDYNFSDVVRKVEMIEGLPNANLYQFIFGGRIESMRLGVNDENVFIILDSEKESISDKFLNNLYFYEGYITDNDDIPSEDQRKAIENKYFKSYQLPMEDTTYVVLKTTAEDIFSFLKDLMMLYGFRPEETVKTKMSSELFHSLFPQSCDCNNQEFAVRFKKEGNNLVDAFLNVSEHTTCIHFTVSSRHLNVRLDCKPSKPNCLFLDENNCKGIGEWLERAGIAEPTGRSEQSGFCTYPEYIFKEGKFTVVNGY